MVDLYVHVFGRFRVESACGVNVAFEGARVRELFALLLLSRKVFAREALADTLWGAQAGLQARKVLRQALWQLQSVLEQQPGCAARVIQADADFVYVQRDVNVWLDLDLFEHAADAVQGVAGSALTVDQAQQVRAAVELHRDPLLTGFYQEWCLVERERLEQRKITLLDKLMAYAQTHREYEAGLRYGEWILLGDRARERTHRRMMQLYFLAGDRTGALRQYARCVAALREELDIAPSGQTRRLYDDLRRDRLDEPIDGAAERVVTTFDMLAEMREVGAGLGQAQYLIQEQQHRMHLLEDRLQGG